MVGCEHVRFEGGIFVTTGGPPLCVFCQVVALTAERDEARAVARQAVAAVKAYAEELNGEKTEHTFDDVIATWPQP